jgi:hypothetical protein
MIQYLKPAALFTMILLSFSALMAQKGEIILNARAGNHTYGIAGTYAAPSASCVEGIFTASHDGSKYLFTGLYEEYYSIGNIKGLQWFAGAGMHIGIERTKKANEATESNNEERLDIPGKTDSEKIITQKKINGGVDVIAGVSYRVPGTFLSIGADIKPYVDFMNSKSLFFDAGIRLGIHF